MKLLNILLIFFLATSVISAQDSLGLTRLGMWDDNTLFDGGGGFQYNDIWGYVSPSGREYAIMGSLQKIHFLEVTDPYNPVEIARFNGGQTSTWRDFKTFQHYAYACTEGNEGLHIFDMSDIDNGTVTKVLTTTSFFTNAHNIYIDVAKSKLYGIGTNTRSNGLNIIDLSVNPANPTQLASPVFTGGYSHDVFVRNDTAYCSHGTKPNGVPRLRVYDVSTPATPLDLGSLATYLEMGYNHSSWLTEDGDHLVFCDETHGRAVKIADVSDLSNISVVDYFESDLLGNSGSIAHNPFIKGDSVYISYYHDGVGVFDISDPTNVTLAAYYDTYPDNTTYSGFAGVWGVYPYLPSGNIIASDDTYGLQVLRFIADLPAELESFTATKKGAKVHLNWTTLTEQNNAYFEVERSVDGMQFEPIVKVEGAGNSQERKSYQSIDEQPKSGLNYYRLKWVDFEGQAEYSSIQTVSFEEKATIQAYPNQLTIGEPIQVHIDAIQGELTLKLYDLSGRKWFETTASTGTINIPTSNLSNGNYLLEVSNTQTYYTEKIILVR